MNKKKLLVFIDWYYPAFKAGGPIKSVSNIVEALREEIDISIITSAYDIGCQEILEGVQTNKWISKEGVNVIYLEKQQQSRSRYKTLIEEVAPDTIYLNSIYSNSFTIKPMVVAKHLKINKVIVAPRGMLGKAALEIKPLKKRIFLSVSRMLGLFTNVQWHASTHLEQKEIELVFGKSATAFIAQNISGKVTQRNLPINFKTPGELRLVFYSRINEKKNLLFAIEVLSKLNVHNIHFDIYGPIEDSDYWNKCQQLMKNTRVDFEYKGLIHPSELVAVLSNYHYLFFPTKHENYGHVIVESLLASLPVVISQETPWVDLERQKAGFDLPLSLVLFEDCLFRLVNQDMESYAEFVNGTRIFSEEYIVNSKVLLDNKKLFLND